MKNLDSLKIYGIIENGIVSKIIVKKVDILLKV